MGGLSGSGKRPIRLNASWTISCLRWSCQSYSTCANAQPPHRRSTLMARRLAEGVMTSTVSANTTALLTRSMRAVTRSPGIAPDTSTTRP